MRVTDLRLELLRAQTNFLQDDLHATNDIATCSWRDSQADALGRPDRVPRTSEKLHLTDHDFRSAATHDHMQMYDQSGATDALRLVTL